MFPKKATESSTKKKDLIEKKITDGLFSCLKTAGKINFC